MEVDGEIEMEAGDVLMTSGPVMIQLFTRPQDDGEYITFARVTPITPEVKS
jgi:hypothetical protein